VSAAPSAPPTAPTRRVRARGPKDLMDRVISKINLTRPRNDDGGTFRLERSTRLKTPRVRYILKTGLEPIDALTGYICFGRVTEIYGLETSGKTSLARVCIVQAQKREIYECVYKDESADYDLKKIDDDVEVVRLYLDNEMSCDRDAKMVFPDPVTGQPVEIDCALGECDTVDQMFKILDNTIDEVEHYIKETGKPCLMMAVVDTIAGTASKEEMSREWGTDDYSRQPKQLREGFRKLSRRIASANVCLICTNQVSEKYQKGPSKGPVSNTPQEGNFTSTGGRALKYWSHLRIFTFTLDQKYVLIRGSKFAAGYLVGFFIKKNRRTKPLREGRLALIFEDGYGLDPTFSRLETLIFLGFAEFKKEAPYDIRFKFTKWGVPMATFGGVTAEGAGHELEEDDDDTGRKSDPRIAERAEWPAFYRDHQADFDALWAKAIDYAFTVEGLSSEAQTARRLDEVDDDADVQNA
jgi:RecA/RadA recombinase